MSASPKSRQLPDSDHLSVLTATLVLAYLITQFIILPARQFALQLPGIYISAEVSVNTVISLFVAGLTATGVDWLMRDHPLLAGRSAWRSALLPTLASWIVSILLARMPFGLLWWGVLAGGVVLLMLTVVAEYIVIDVEDLRYPIAVAWLTAISYVLFLVLATALHTIGSRLVFLLPGLAFTGWLVALRTLHLRLQGEWPTLDATVISLILGQWIAALHYWPLSPLTFGLIALGILYALTSFAGGLGEGRTIRQAMVEPLIGLAVVLAGALWAR